MVIDSILHQIWIGDLPKPTVWMDTWKLYHSNWAYMLWDNSSLSTFEFKNKHLIDEYIRRNRFSGAADLMRYEILYNFGGFLPPSDSICYKNTDVLFTNGELFTSYESEKMRPGRITPIYAANRGNDFLLNMINELHTLEPADLMSPIKSVGNVFVTKMVHNLNPDITIFPSCYFVPEWLDNTVSVECDTIYAKQMFGSAKRLYDKI
jgi:mannosyltransferase OCH1-like enzyme